MLTTALLNSSPLGTLVDRPDHDGYGGGLMMGWVPGWWVLLIPLFWIIVLGAFCAIFGRRWRRGMRNGYGHPGWPVAADAASSAEKTLAERFAQGDIDEVEYRARLEVLRANRPGPQAPPS